MFGHAARTRRSSSPTRSAPGYRLLRSEALEPRTLLSGNGLFAWLSPAALLGAKVAANAPPTIAQPISINANAAVTGKTALLSVLGADDGGAANLTYTWSVTSAPAGGTVTFSSNNINAARSSTATFSMAGTYSFTVKIVDAGGLSVSSSKSVVVSPTLAGISIKTTSGQVVTSGTPLTVAGTVQLFAAQGLDQFGNALSLPTTYTWSTASLPSGAAAPQVASSANIEGVMFSAAGNYGLTAKATAGGVSVSTNVAVSVTQVLTSVSIKTASGQVVTPGTTTTVAGAAQSFVVQGLDQFGKALSTAATYTWSTASLPSGAAAPKLTSSGNVEGVTFSAAGSYGLTVKVMAGGVSISTNESISVTQVWTSTKYPAVTTVYVTGTSLQPVMPAFLDQFGNPLTSPPALTWSTVNLPAGAAAPIFTTSGNLTTVTFGLAGNYMLQAKGTTASSVSFVTLVTVNQTLTSIAVTPNTAAVFEGANQQFTAQALDQFQKPMAAQPALAWSSNGGAVTSGGVFTAPNNVNSYTVTAKSGTLAGTATVNVLASSGWNTAALAVLVPSLDADGSISRLDMIQILTSVAGNGKVTAGEFADLKTIVSEATTLNIPSYVDVLANDVVNGNPANATYQGTALGNLAVGSSSAQLTELIDKWFLGTDHPALCNTSLVYKSTAGSLFPRTPSHLDEYQGGLGDCYLISALGTLADSNPAAIENAIIDNGDGTYTVRFYSGPLGVINNGSGTISAGFSTGVGTADYVTVDNMLPASSAGILQYADYGASCSNSANALWIPLIEKAYAQWNQTGKEGGDGQNAYCDIQGGWMATVDAHVLGYNANDFIMTSTAEQVATNALAAHEAVTIGTQNWSAATNLGLYANHAYAITAYNAKTDTFTLYNPWGSSPGEIQYQPGQLSWAQLQATCTQLCVCSTSGAVPFAGVAKVGSAGGSLPAGARAGVSLPAQWVADASPVAAGQGGHSRRFGQRAASTLRKHGLQRGECFATILASRPRARCPGCLAG